MKILHIASIGNNPFEGVSVVVPQYVRSQIEQGNTVGLINVSGTIINDMNAQILLDEEFSMEALPEHISDPDIAVFHECYRPEYLKISRTLRAAGIPYVIVPHGSLGKEAQQKKALKKKIGNILFFNRFIQGAAALQMLSQKEYDNTFFGRKKIIATNGVILPGIKKESFSKDGLDFFYFFCLDAYHKGLDILVDALSRIKRQFVENNCRLSIYGPDHQGRFENLSNLVINHDLSDVIELHHEISGQEKIERLLKADVFIQSSRFEGMPLGVLEALSYGVPCVVTRGTNIGEEIESYKAGWMSETDPACLAEVILKVISEKRCLKEFGQNGVSLVKDRYAWGVITKNTVDQYRELVRKCSKN